MAQTVSVYHAPLKKKLKHYSIVEQLSQFLF